MTFFQFIVWVPAAIAAYRLWGDVTWLSVIVALAGISYGAHANEQVYYEVHGEHSTSTATRLAFTALFVWGVCIYSLFV